MLPQTTRLRWVRAKRPETIEKFCFSLGKRIEIKSIYHADGYVWVWFVPDDKLSDVRSGTLKDVQNKKENSNEIIN